MKEPRRLVEDSALFAQLVDDAKRREPPPEALAGLLGKLGASSELPAVTAGTPTRKWGWTAVATAACVVAVGAVSFGVMQNHAEPSIASSAVGPAPTVVTHSLAETPSPESSNPELPAVPSISIDELPSSANVAPSARAHVVAPPSASSTSSTFAPAAKPSVRREIELIARAREALTKGDTRACLDAVDTHDREFPEGQFMREAKVMRIEGSLAAGDRVTARALARDYLAKNPGSPYEARVRSLLSSMEDR